MPFSGSGKHATGLLNREGGMERRADASEVTDGDTLMQERASWEGSRFSP